MNIKVYVPEGVTNISIVNTTISFYLMVGDQETEVWHESNAPLQGADEIPAREGYYYVDIISHDSYVEINRTV